MRRAGLLGGLAAWLGFTLPSAVALTALGLLTAVGRPLGRRVAPRAEARRGGRRRAGRLGHGRALAPDWPRRAVALAAAAVALALTDALRAGRDHRGGAVIGRWSSLAPPAPPRGPRRPVLAPGRRRRARRCSPCCSSGCRCCAGRAGSRSRCSTLLPFGCARLRRRPRRAAAAARDRRRSRLGQRRPVPGRLRLGAGRARPAVHLRRRTSALAIRSRTASPGATIALVAIFLPVVPAGLRRAAVLGLRCAARSAPAAPCPGTNAAVVGILLAALYTPVWTSAIEGPLDVAVAAGALALLLTGRVPPIVVVGLCALAGQVARRSA